MLGGRRLESRHENRVEKLPHLKAPETDALAIGYFVGCYCFVLYWSQTLVAFLVFSKPCYDNSQPPTGDSMRGSGVQMAESVGGVLWF